jgi:histidinol-phosphate phosphatase family protein
VKQLVILAGGKGTRLRERLGELPKPLVDICGVPLLERQVLLAKKHGFTHVLVLVNHAARHIVDYCASKRNWGLDIACIDDGQPRGTAGATLAVFDRLAEEFLVMYGDTMLEVDLARFHAHHRRVPAVSATLFLHPNDHPHDSDLVEIDDDERITGFHPYPHDGERYYPNLVNAALYWVAKRALAPWRDEQRMLDFARDLFPAMLRGGMTLRGYNSPEYIKDIGTPARLDRVCADFRSGKIARASLDRPQPMVFLDRDGTMNREVDHLRSPDQLELLPGVQQAIKRLNASEYRCCVVTNQPVIARGECSVEGLRQIHNKMETLLGREGAYVDRIYYCPHHPDKGFAGERPEFKVDCDCRKPKTGMIDRAARDFNVARARAWLIGDTTVDMETARRAGLKSILVETGYAGLDYRAWATPDAIVPDLDAAVSFILDRYPDLLRFCSNLAGAIREGAVVLVGGQSRSGKSTFAGVLRDAIRERGGSALILSADRWLKSERERGPGVLGRYDMAALQTLVDALAGGGMRPRVLTLPGYHKLKRERVAAVESVPLSPADVVVVEGTVALGLRTPVAIETHRFHIDIDEPARRARVLGEYRLRGFGETEAERVYASRRLEEFPLIDGLARGARRIDIAPAAS